MLSFDNKSPEKVILKYNSTHECSTLDSVKSNIYFKIPSIQNYTTSVLLRNTTYEAYIPSINYKWEDYARNFGKHFLNIITTGLKRRH